MSAVHRGIVGVLVAWIALPALPRGAAGQGGDTTRAGAESTATTAAPDTSLHVTFGGFVDAYYAYDFDRPPALDRAYTTQAARHDEVNINLAFLDATLTGARIRGRFAAQFGTAVQANYAAEPHTGTLSGPDVSRFIQEAYVGYRVAPTLWVDGGVFFSPFGSESWISRDNWTYTRSLIADNSPFYEAGVRVAWQATPALAVQLHVINGWQNISETNSDKALGLRLDYAPGSGADVAYDAFVGNEQPDSLPSRLRVWQEGIVQLQPTAALGLRFTFDYGLQRRGAAAGGGNATWHGWATVARWRFTPAVAVAGRAERYTDPEQVIVVTGAPFGLRATGGSLTVDVTAAAKLLWRVEGRYLSTRDPVFPDRSAPGGFSRHDTVLLTSLALTF